MSIASRSGAILVGASKHFASSLAGFSCEALFTWQEKAEKGESLHRAWLWKLVLWVESYVSRSVQLGLNTFTCLNNLGCALDMRSQECLVGSICKILASFSDLSAFQSELLRARNSEPICSAAKLAKLMFSSMVETQSAQLTSESLASKKKDRYAFPVKDDGSCQPWGSAGAMIKAFGFRSSRRIDALCIKKLMQPFACPFAVALSSSNQRKWPSWTTQIRGCLSQLIIRNIALRLLGLALRRKPRQLGGRVSKAHSTVLVTVDPEDFHSNDSNSPANTSTQNSAFYCDILMLLSLDLILLFAVDLAETSGCSGLSSCRELCVLPLDIASLSRPRARGRIYTISHKYNGQWGNASTLNTQTTFSKADRTNTNTPSYTFHSIPMQIQKCCTEFAKAQYLWAARHRQLQTLIGWAPVHVFLAPCQRFRFQRPDSMTGGAQKSLPS